MRPPPPHVPMDKVRRAANGAMEWYWSCYLGPDHRPCDIPLPGDLRDVSVLPPTTIVTAEYDPLCDEADHFYNRLIDAKVDAELTCYDGLIHGFLSLPAHAPQSDAAFRALCFRMRAALGARI